MVVKTMKWSPWQPAVTESRRFSVVVKPMKLEGFDNLKDQEKDGGREKAMVIKMRWKGQVKPSLVPFHRGSRRYKDCSGERFVKKGKLITWDDEFENVCNFSVVWRDGENKFLPWDVSFKLQYGEYRGKKSEIGKASLNLAEITSNESILVKQLPLDLHIAGTTRHATLSVLVIYVEISDSDQDPTLLVRNSSWFGGMLRNGHVTNTKKETSLYDSNESVVFDSQGTSETWSTTESQSSPNSDTQLDQQVNKKVGFFSWKKRRLSFRANHTKVEPLTISGPLQGTGGIVPRGPNKQDENNTMGNWEARELTSRDGHTKLKANVFFASFDQRSNKAAGESACTALVAVIAHWLQSNQQAIPTRTEFDNLIIDGSSEWRKLCGKEAFVNQFPNKHFDLETVLRAGIRPITVSPQKSFVGFFSPEKFEVLKGAMSFDEIWNEIGRHRQEDGEVSRIYLVSWNDHFFVLKADADAYYIIDTLGERLYEGCTQAYILRFDDDSSLMLQGKTEEGKVTTEDETEASYTGTDCCREFIKRFLAAIPLGELELEERKAAVPYYSLHNRLQIEFNFSTSLPSPTSLFSASAAVSTN